MRHGVDHRKLGRTDAHRKALLRNLVTSLILKERIETTLPKAKELRRIADRMITWGKQGDLSARRQASRVLMTADALKKLFDGLASRFKDRQGGYTRIMHLGARGGDGAPMALIEYLGYELPKQEKKKGEKKEEKVVAEKKPSKKAAVAEVTVAPAPKGKKTEKKTEKEKGEKKGWGIFGRKGSKKKES